ncbi:ABC-2 type transport system permease protein [Anaerotaenia torta]|uniref:ABC transporter permease n=1 Tax=Anaerotaenia torta TaxID=433293 RepID=UPI003D228152
MMKNLRFIRLLLRLKLSHMMVFRLSFFGAFLADGVLFVVQLLTFNIIYSQVDTIGDWSRGQMLVFIGTFSMINGLNMLIYFFGVLTIPQKIREGALDLYITKPGNTLLRLTFENVNPGSAPLLLLSGGIIAYGISVLEIVVTVPLICVYIILLLLMTLLYYDMELILRTIPFFVISASAIDRLEDEMLTLNFKIPGVLFKGMFKIIFYFVLPYGVMATVPTQLISGTLSVPGLIQALSVAGVFTAFAIWFWRLGLKHYKSASS